MLSPSSHLIAVGILISQLAVGYFDTNDKLLPQIPTTSSSSITINYHPPIPPTVINTNINMARSTSTTTAKAAKSAAATTTTKRTSPRNPVPQGPYNVNEIIQNINKPNSSRLQVNLTSLNKNKNTPNPNISATTDPITTDTAADVSPDSTANQNNSPTSTIDNPTPSNNNNNNSPSNNDNDAVQNNDTTTPPSNNNDAVQQNNNGNNANVAPPLPDGNDIDLMEVDTEEETPTSNKNTTPSVQAPPAATSRSSLRKGTPINKVPNSFAAQTRESLEELRREHAAKRSSDIEHSTIVGAHNETIRVIKDRENMLVKEFVSGDENFSRDYWVEDWLGEYAVYPVVTLGFSTNGSTSAENMNQFATTCCKGLLSELLIVDPNMSIVPLNVTDTTPANAWKKTSDVPKNFTKLTRVIKINGGSWCFDPKSDKPTNDIYASFRLKSTLPLEEVLQAVGFEFKRIGGGMLMKKKHQSLNTETPYMLLFVHNKTEESSVCRDLTDIFKMVRDQLREDDLLPEEYDRDENEREIPFAIRVNGPRMPGEQRKKNNKKDKNFDRLNDQGKKVIHFEVAKEDLAEFSFLAEAAHRMGLDTEYWGKFAKLTACLTNNSPSGDMKLLRRCIQGHLSFHLSTTTVILAGVDNLDATAVLKNPVNGAIIASKSARDMLYKITLEGGGPLFLQIGQRSNGDVEVVIPNSAEAEAKAEMINRQVAAFCTHLWKDQGLPDVFVKKLVERTMCARLIHEIGQCEWDKENQIITTPNDKSDADAIREFEAQEWVKALVDSGATAAKSTKKKHVDPNAAFPFSDDFSVGTIHGNKNVRAETRTTQAADGTPILHLGKKDVINVDDEDDDDEVSVLSSKTTTKGTEAHPTNANESGNATAADESGDSSSTSDEGNEDEPVSDNG